MHFSWLTPSVDALRSPGPVLQLRRTALSTDLTATIQCAGGWDLADPCFETWPPGALELQEYLSFFQPKSLGVVPGTLHYASTGDAALKCLEELT